MDCEALMRWPILTDKVKKIDGVLETHGWHGAPLRMGDRFGEIVDFQVIDRGKSPMRDEVDLMGFTNGNENFLWVWFIEKLNVEFWKDGELHRGLLYN